MRKVPKSIFTVPKVASLLIAIVQVNVLCVVLLESHIKIIIIYS